MADTRLFVCLSYTPANGWSILHAATLDLSMGADGSTLSASLRLTARGEGSILFMEKWVSWVFARVYVDGKAVG